MEYEEKIHCARDLCLEIGAIDECELHEGEYSDTLEYLDLDELISEILEHTPEGRKHFNNRAEMFTCIQEVMNSTGEECGYCAKNRDS